MKEIHVQYGVDFMKLVDQLRVYPAVKHVLLDSIFTSWYAGPNDSKKHFNSVLESSDEMFRYDDFKMDFQEWHPDQDEPIILGNTLLYLSEYCADFAIFHQGSEGKLTDDEESLSTEGMLTIGKNEKREFHCPYFIVDFNKDISKQLKLRFKPDGLYLVVEDWNSVVVSDNKLLTEGFQLVSIDTFYDRLFGPLDSELCPFTVDKLVEAGIDNIIRQKMIERANDFPSHLKLYGLDVSSFDQPVDPAIVESINSLDEEK